MAARKKKRTTAKAAEETHWDPNRQSFDQGRPYVLKQLKAAGLKPDSRIFTSRDPKAQAAMKRLKTLNSPDGFEKWQLPFSFLHPTNLYITVGKPGATVEEHSHDEGAGMRFILDGTATYNGKTLKTGDWIYVPKGESYALKAGPRGVKLLADYAC